MANKIQVKRGLEANLPTLDVGEPAFTTDSKKPFMGSDTGNIELATKEQINSLDAQKADQTDLESEVTNRTNAVATEKSERIAEVAVERARIDNFTALAEGSTTGDAELIDARIGADGITYNNAGGAIRNQVGSLRDNLIEISSFGTQILNLDFEYGGISASTGGETIGNNRLRSDYIECNGMAIIITPSVDYTVNVYYYDSDTNYSNKNNGYTENSIIVKYTGFIRITIAQTSNFPNEKNNGYAKISKATSIGDRLSTVEFVAKNNVVSIEYLSNILLSDNEEISVSYISGAIDQETGLIIPDVTKCRSGYINFSNLDRLIIRTEHLAKVTFMFFATGGTYIAGLSEYYTGILDVKEIATANSIDYDDSVMVRIVISYHDDREVTSIEELSSYIHIMNLNSDVLERENLTFKSTIMPTISIRCAKEVTYNDGTAPKVEWYLVEDVVNQKFYMTKDFVTYKYLFTFNAPRGSFYYKFGITKCNDIIAVFRTETLENVTAHSDEFRENPYVLLASENYKTIHEVDFGTNLKPSGWLQNVGFKSLPSGETIFCEYTRPSVATANAWVLDGDITDSANWNVTKSFMLSGDTSVGFKHCHAIMHDHYTGIVYLSTGDDDDGAQIWYSTDNGNTWTQISPPNHTDNEKYCRMLNYIFTKDYVYWASDTPKLEKHYIFRTVRQVSGVIDYNNITDLKQIPSAGGSFATYGTAYLPEYDMLFLADRSDGSNALSMPVRAYIISSGELLTLGEIETADGNGHYLGFRTEYTEYYPEDLKIKFGFGTKYPLGDYTNAIKGFGNNANASPNNNVNNLYLKPYKKADGAFSFRLGTFY